jgi:NAD-dependent deacetylase
MDNITQNIQKAELFAAIGTSGIVYPAAGFVAEAKNRGIRTCEINLETTVNNPLFDEAFHGPAGEIVPIWCRSILASLDAGG